jgi:hypothetical protein
MKHILVFVGLLALVLTMTVLAANPHFIGQPTAEFDGTDSVRVSWKEAGLGDNQQITYVATATASATFVCVNNGGQCPNAANKTTVNGPVSAIGIFSSGKNGQITASLTIHAPDAGGFMCPNGQNLVLSEVSFSNIQVTDATNAVTASAKPSTFSATLFTCP